METVETRVARLETQVTRIVSDIESEKSTRVRVSSAVADEIRDLRNALARTDKIVAAGVGVLATIQTVLHFIK